MNQQKPLYFENLDGLRAIAAFAVIFAHISYWFEYPTTHFFVALKSVFSYNGAGGRLGVIFFFVLSGFLITYLMFLEQAKNGKLNIPHFYKRRILRIWPLYYLTLIVGFIIYPLCVWLFGNVHQEGANWLLYSIFAANFDHIYNYFPATNILGVQWSVSVEEQFYLLWPLVFVFFNKKKIFPFVLIAFILISELFSILVASHLKAGDYHFGSCFKYLSFGGLIAYLCYNKTESINFFLHKINRWLCFLIYFTCIMLMFFQNELTKTFASYNYLYHIIPILFFGFVIVEQNFSKNSFFKIGNFPLLNWLGKISYGLYLTHMIAINIVIGFFTKSSDFVLLKGLLSILLTILISYFSYNYFEKYFLSFKHSKIKKQEII